MTPIPPDSTYSNGPHDMPLSEYVPKNVAFLPRNQLEALIQALQQEGYQVGKHSYVSCSYITNLLL